MSISDEILRLQTAKSDLATAIANKGVTVPANATLDDYAALVDSIQTGGGGSTLPYDAEVEYLQGNNDTYIDTEVKASSNIEFELGLSIMSSLPQSSSVIVQIFGSRVANKNAALTIQYYNLAASQYWRWCFANAENTVSSTAKGFYFLTNIGNKNTLVTTGAKISNVSCANDAFSNNYNIFIFALNSAGTESINYNNYVQVHFCRLRESGVLVRDFIPVRVGQVGYMYDNVSNTLFGNAGSGSFTLGSDV